MRVLMIARQTLNASPGGDTVQINSTALYLKKLGVDVDIALADDTIDYNKYDLIHFFNIIRPDDIISHIRKTKLPYVISTIFVDYTEYEKQNRKGLIKIITKLFSGDQLEYLKTILRFFINGDKIKSLYYLLHGHKAAIRYVAKHASMLLPNSASEYNRFKASYNTSNRFLKVPNAVDVSVFTDEIKSNEAYHDHILCVGRIEGRKNQLNLIKALKDTNLKLTIIGKASPNHAKYYKECFDMAAGSNNVQMIEHIDHDELSAIYKAAKVHVLASWFETTGLSSLEAAMMDCNLVITKNGDTEEYFEDMAYYCEPDDVNSIRDAVLKAFNDPVNPRLKQVIIDNYTWEKAASETLSAYKTVLKR